MIDNLEGILTGKSEKHLVYSEIFAHYIHRDIEVPLKHLQRRAKMEGIDLQLVSGFRSFDKQMMIWNKKASGQKALLDPNGLALNFNELSRDEVLKAILRWSAIPGASRHHWGTDIDVVDAKTIPANYEVQLTPQECNQGGIFNKLHVWLDELIENGNSEGFFRPYNVDRGGVSPEKWHLSFAPISEEYRDIYTLELFTNLIENSTQMALRELVLQDVDYYYNTYVNNISEVPF